MGAETEPKPVDLVMVSLGTMNRWLLNHSLSF